MPYTRSQVANRIGRSVATVRQMERVGVLSPTVGPDQKRSFHADDVERVVGYIERTGRALPFGAAAEADLTDTVVDLRASLDNARRRIADLEAAADTVKADHDRFRFQLIAEFDKVIAFAAPRNQRMLAALERMLRLFGV